MRFIFHIALILFSLNTLNAQEIILPNVFGQQLLDQLKQQYKPSSVQGYNNARDILYGQIDNHNNSLTCVYTGYTISVPYGTANPRNYTNAANPIMNAEHTWPQSQGATGNAKSDMHHLFPTNGNANSGRGSFPFAEINDNNTDKWYRNTTISGNTPSQFIDEYSELDENNSFEPREDHKGNVARAVFYFYTMYKDQVGGPSFFNAQKDVLREWSNDDPVDQAEIDRTNWIGTYQQNKPNPFVLDTTLIGRAYFGVTTGIDVTEQTPSNFVLHQNYPNPFNPSTTIEFSLAKTNFITITIYNTAGQTVRTLVNRDYISGSYSVKWDGLNAHNSPVVSGIYYYQLQANDITISKKMLLIR